MNFLRMNYLHIYINYLQNYLFDLERIEFNDINIDKLIHVQHNQVLPIVERWTCEESVWNINSVMQHQLRISHL